MKKMTLFIIATLIGFGASYGIGYYVGYNVIDVKQPSPTQSEQQAGFTTQASELDTTVESLKESLEQEKAKSLELQQELQQHKRKVAQLESFAMDSALPPKDTVTPATAYERTNFVMNLVHQFNADNASTEIIETDCSDDLCFLTAKVSAGTSTNPEISNLMKFLDEKKLPEHYQKVNLLNMTKNDDGSARVKFSLNL